MSKTDPTKRKYSAKSGKRYGRDGHYTPEIGKIICKIVETHGCITYAAESVGICRKTAYNWQLLGMKGDERYANFYHDFCIARAKYISKLRGKVQKSSDWRAAAWLMEKIDPNVFGPQPNKVELTGPNGTPVQTKTKVILTYPVAMPIGAAPTTGDDNNE